jgi:serine/threonine-protein kinase RsbW
MSEIEFELEHPTETVELTIKARPENLSLARLALGGVAGRIGAPEDVVADLKVAVTEACTNAIQHAYGDSIASEQLIVVRFNASARALTVEVEDSGAGFDPAQPPRENGNGSNGHGRGLGLLIIRELSDQCTVESTRSGTRISFRRWLPAPE